MGAKEASTACALDSRFAAEREHIDARSAASQEPVDGVRFIVALNRDGDDGDNDNDATFRRQSGLEQSAQFANHGSADSFADDRSSFGGDDDFDGFGSDLKRQIT